MTITAPDAPTLPSLNDPANFNTRALALFSWLVTEYIPWLETLAGVTEDGEINGTPIGQKAAAVGKFTTLLADSLGGAAVQSSATDATAGKLMKVGAFGLGAYLRPTQPELVDANADNLSTGIFPFNGSTGGIPESGYGILYHAARYNAGEQVQTLYYVNMDRVYYRRRPTGGGWGPWYQVLTSQGAQTISGDLTVNGTPMLDGNYREIKQRVSTANGIGVLGGTSNQTGASIALYGATHPSQAGNFYTTYGGQGGTGDFILRHTDGSGFFENVRVKADGKVGIGTGTPAYRLHVREQDLATAASVWATHTSFASSALQLNVVRAANPAYNFFQAYSGNLGDKEFQLGGDGLGTSDLGWQGGGADYAEYFEWLDGNPNGEVRTGMAVVLEGDKIRPAQEGETPIGVISANPSVIGDGDIDRWKGKYLRDDFGAYIWEDYETISWTETVTETVQEQATEAQEVTREVIEVVNGKAIKRTITETVQVPLFDEFPLEDEDGNALGIHREPRMIEVQKQTTKDEKRSYASDEVPEGVTVPEDAERVTQQRRKLNPAYDPSQPYVPRAERPEWDMVGLMGKLRLRKGQPVAPNWIKMRDISTEVEEWLVK